MKPSNSFFICANCFLSMDLFDDENEGCLGVEQVGKIQALSREVSNACNVANVCLTFRDLTVFHFLMLVAHLNRQDVRENVMAFHIVAFLTRLLELLYELQPQYSRR